MHEAPSMYDVDRAVACSRRKIVFGKKTAEIYALIGYRALAYLNTDILFRNLSYRKVIL